MFSGRENPTGMPNVNKEKLLAQIFASKKRIVEQFKQQVDLYDQNLACKCLLAGVPTPSWLQSSLPSQTSELNKEEIISGLLFPQSRSSIICPGSRPFPYQQPVNLLAENVVRQDLTSNNPLKEQLLEEEPQQPELSQNLIRRISNHSQEKDVNIASSRYVHKEEGLPESVSISCREKKNSPSPEYSQNQRVEISFDATSPGCSQGKMVPMTVSTTGCEQKPPSPEIFQDETEPNTCLDPGLPLPMMQRSKSRQKALELRSSAKASKSRSNSKNELKPSPLGNIGLEIASLRSDDVSEINLFKHDENDERIQDDVENTNSQGKGGDRCFKFSSTTESSTPHQKVDSVQKSCSGFASIVPGFLLESGRMNEMDILQSIETTDEVPSKVDKQVDNPQSRTCNETADLDRDTTRSKSSSQDNSRRKHPESISHKETTYLDGGMRTKSSSKDSSKRTRQKSSNSFSGDFPSRNSNPSHWVDHELELSHVIPKTTEVSLGTDAGTSFFQSDTITRSRSNSRGNRSKSEPSGSVESSSVDVVPRDSVSSLQGGHVKESPSPITVDAEGLVENIASDQPKEKGEFADTNRCSSAGRVIQTGNSRDESTYGGTILDSKSKAAVLGFVESSSVELQSRDSVMKSDDESVLVRPITVTGEALLVDEKNNGGSTEVSSISRPTSLCQIDITVVEPVVVEYTLQERDSPPESVLVKPITVAGEALLVDEKNKVGSTEVSSNSKPTSLRQTDITAVEPVVVEYTLQESDSPLESVLVRPITVTGEALIVDEKNNGGSTEISSILKPTSLSQTDITVVEPVVVEYTLEESDSPPENLIDHSKRCDSSCGSKEVQPHGSLTKGGNNQCPGRISLPRSSAIVEKSANENKALFVGSDHKSADKQLEVSERNSSLGTNDLPVFVKPGLPHFDDDEGCSFGEIPFNSREKTTMELGPTPASAFTARVFDVSFLTDSEIHLSADTERNDIENHNEMIPETELPASLTGLEVGENESPESNTFTRNAEALTKRPQHEASSGKGVPPINSNIACTETGDFHGPEDSIQQSFCSSSSMRSPQLQNKRRRTLEKLTSRMLLSNPRGENLDSDSVRETVHHREEATCHNHDDYEVELQKMIGSASSDQYAVELQKMIGSASSDELRFDECFLFKEAGLRSPASFSFRPELLSVQRSQIADHIIKSENTNLLPCAGENSYPLVSHLVRDSDSSPCLPPVGLLGSHDESPPVLEGFIIQSGDENQSGSKNNRNHDSFHLPRTSAESAAIMEQICKSACMTTPSLHLAKTFKFAGKLDLDQSVSSELLDGMYFSQNLEASSVFDSLGINHDYTRSCTESSSVDVRNLCTSPAEKLWYMQKSSSSEKRVIQTPDLPCISEENENVDEEAENLCPNTPKSMISEKRGSSILDLPCIAEENENIDEITEAINEASDTERENVPAERKPLGDVNADPMKFLPSVSEAKIPVDRQSLDSINTAFSFSAKCDSVKSKRKQNDGNRRFTGKGKENKSGAGARRNVKPPSSRFSKPKLSCNSSLTSVGLRLPEKEPRHNNIISDITSFVPLVQQQKLAAPLITGKRDVKVKALEAAEASKRIAEQKENDRKMKKEAMKLERARQEQENRRKQEMEEKKKEEDRKKKEAEVVWKQEMEKKKKEEERKRKQFEMADRKRQREEEDKKLKEAKRQRIAEIQRQQREADEKLQAEKELKRQAMDAKIKAQKELKEHLSKAENTRRQANTRIPGVRPKNNSSDDTNASRDDDFKVISNTGKMSEESYDISPFKCSDDEEEEEEDDDDNISNHKFVPTWASKENLLAVTCQQQLDPEVIFSAKCFRDTSKVRLGRKFQSR